MIVLKLASEVEAGCCHEEGVVGNHRAGDVEPLEEDCCDGDGSLRYLAPQVI